MTNRVKPDEIEFKYKNGKVEYREALYITDNKSFEQVRNEVEGGIAMLWENAFQNQSIDMVEFDETVKSHEETMTELAKGGRDRWREFLERKVVDNEWGESRTMDLVEDYFILNEEEEEFMRKWIEIFRRVRIDNMDLEKAKKHVEHEMDPTQRSLGEMA